jgi:hypothetical protein
MADFLKDVERAMERVRAGELEGFTPENIQEIAHILAVETQVPQMLMESKRSMLGGGVDTSGVKQFLADVDKITGYQADPQSAVRGGEAQMPSAPTMPSTPQQGMTQNMGTQLQAASELPSSSPFNLGGSQ